MSIAVSLDYSTKELVRAEALKLRQQHDALSWGVTVDDLIKLRGIDQSRYGSPFSAFGQAFTRLTSGVVKKVKALFSLKESVILLSNDLPEAKEPFAKGHELGHAVIPWHKEILYVCDEHDLSPATRAQMEFEANAFAGAVLLPEELVKKIHAEYPTSMSTVLHLKQLSGASIAATANAYVDHHPGKCILMIMEEADGQDDGGAALVLKRKWVSRAAVRSPMSGLTTGQRFGPGHVMWEASRIRGQVREAQLHFSSDPQKVYAVSLLNNSYQVIALMYDETA